MGDGIPFPAYRVASNKDGTLLVAVTLSPPALWRWNGTATNWKRFDLDLEPLDPDTELPAIYNIAFGVNKLFLLGKDYIHFSFAFFSNYLLVWFL
jgi:hypothetical protein